MFDLDHFVADCVHAVGNGDAQQTIRALMQRALSSPTEVMAALGEPTEGGLSPIYRSKELTIMNPVWRPGMMLPPHNHNMWALIGIYTGREDGMYWRRIEDHPQGLIEAAGAEALGAGDVATLGRDVIHSVVNPIQRLTGTLHIYGGDFFGQERSEWDAETLVESPFNLTAFQERFLGTVHSKDSENSV